MKKSFLLPFVVLGLILGCAGRGPHVRWAPDLSAGLDQANASDKPVIIEFTSPT